MASASASASSPTPAPTGITPYQFELIKKEYTTKKNFKGKNFPCCSTSPCDYHEVPGDTGNSWHGQVGIVVKCNKCGGQFSWC